MSIINLEKYKEENTPHQTGKVRCLACDHTFIKVAALGELWFECPMCKLIKVTWIFPTEWSKPHWKCLCGNSLFYVTPEFIYCPSCGNTQMERT